MVSRVWRQRTYKQQVIAVFDGGELVVPHGGRVWWESGYCRVEERSRRGMPEEAEMLRTEVGR